MRATPWTRRCWTISRPRGSNSTATLPFRVIVNTGEGRAFQTGLDVVQLARQPEALRKQSGRTRRSELKMTSWHNQVWKPVICCSERHLRRRRAALCGRC